jgi:CheY-like chemotaxis protein
LKAKEKAEESDRLKSAFLANMSHEIRTPMNGILGFAELLKNPKLTGEELQEFIEVIEKSGVRMLNILNDLIDISRIESGQMNISFSPVNINHVTAFIYTFFKHSVAENGLDFSYKNGLPSEEVVIKTDREKVIAVLINLIRNAIKFTPTGSIQFGYEKKLKTIEFYVKDTGVGISTDQKNIIFERFRKGSESIDKNYEGAGLGLSISRSYVEMLGGKIWIESPPADSPDGIGSIFYFTVPYVVDIEEPVVEINPVSINEAEHQGANLKILIVEDDYASEILISRIISNISREILKSETGVEAVETCRNQKDIDLILMDMKMTEMDGYEATRQIRQFNRDVVIIAQTAYALAGDREKAVAAGCNDYISKPINRYELLTLINKYFN